MAKETGNTSKSQAIRRSRRGRLKVIEVRVVVVPSEGGDVETECRAAAFRKSLGKLLLRLGQADLVD